MKYAIKLIAFLVIVTALLSLINYLTKTHPANFANDLAKGITSNKVTGIKADDDFIKTVAGFSLELFKRSFSDRENTLISPLSVMLALSMAANGAEGETRAQMERVLGGDTRLDTLNEYLYGYTRALPNTEKSKTLIANSIWIRENLNRLSVMPAFLQKNADYYSAAVYRAPFSAQTVKDINKWVEENTDGMINEVLDEIKNDHMLFLINAITFDAEWKYIYQVNDIRKSDFTDFYGNKTEVDFMFSIESRYINAGPTQGFIKPYVEGYSFVAILPDTKLSMSAYIDMLTGEDFMNMVKTGRNNSSFIHAYLPKFEYDFKLTMNDALISLGIHDAFTGAADFSKMATSPEGPLCISEVLHKTYISVDERGTRAGAVTSVGAVPASGPMATIWLNRPFIYAIVDDATEIPIFIGTVGIL